METRRNLTGNNEPELWQQLEADLAQSADFLEYRAILHQGGQEIFLDIDSDPGGGFEGGFYQTALTASFSNPDHFLFALHHANFLDELGKFLGLQDIETGHPDFDQAIVVKANDETKVRTLLADESVRAALLSLPDFTFHTVLPHHEAPGNDACNLELRTGEVIADHRLRGVYNAFFRVLIALNQEVELKPYV